MAIAVTTVLMQTVLMWVSIRSRCGRGVELDIIGIIKVCKRRWNNQP